MQKTSFPNCLQKLKRKIKYSQQFNNDLRNIIKFYDKLGAHRHGLDVASKIRLATSLLKDYPELGAILDIVFPDQKSRRYIYTAGYIIIYKLDLDVIYILRVYSTKQDYIKLLFDSTPLS